MKKLRAQTRFLPCRAPITFPRMRDALIFWNCYDCFRLLVYQINQLSFFCDWRDEYSTNRLCAFTADENRVRVVLPSEPDGIVLLNLLLADMAFSHGAKIVKLFFRLVFYLLAHHLDGLLEVCVVGHGHAASVETVVEE